jgi:hypothetical protein
MPQKFPTPTASTPGADHGFRSFVSSNSPKLDACPREILNRIITSLVNTTVTVGTPPSSQMNLSSDFKASNDGGIPQHTRDP